MNILVLTRYFPPEIGTASHLFYELCETLTQMGHQVTAVTGMPWYNLDNIDLKYKNKIFLTEQLNDINVIRITDIPLKKHGLRIKVGHFSTPVSLWFASLKAHKPDIIIFYSPPLLLGLTAFMLSKKWKVPFVMNLQDLYPLCLIDYGYPSAFITIMEKIETFIYNKAEFITVHSKGNRDFLINYKEQSPHKIKVINNWVDTNFITPGPKHNNFSKLHNPNNDFIISYAGTMGGGQGLKSILDTASLLKDNHQLKFLMIGGGVEKEALLKGTEEKALDNVTFLPMQLQSVYPDILRASDICLSTLGKNISAPVVPSKILSIMAAGRPVLASMPLHGDAPKLIQESQCGICLEPENPEAMAEAILKLYNNPELREQYGKNGRRYVEEHFSRKACISRYEALFQEAVKQNSDRQ